METKGDALKPATDIDPYRENERSRTKYSNAVQCLYDTLQRNQTDTNYSNTAPRFDLRARYNAAQDRNQEASGPANATI